MKTVSLKNLSELPFAAKAVLEFAGGKKIFCFYGELGAGKTTLIKEICRQLGVTDKGSSPTFSLVNEYKAQPPEGGKTNAGSEFPLRGIKGASIFHFDLYRLKNETEIYDIGYEDYLFSANYCFIEWPEKIERLLPSDIVKVKIDVKKGERIISIS